LKKPTGSVSVLQAWNRKNQTEPNQKNQAKPRNPRKPEKTEPNRKNQTGLNRFFSKKIKTGRFELVSVQFWFFLNQFGYFFNKNQTEQKMITRLVEHFDF